MKRYCIAILIISLFLLMCGCNQQNTDYQVPVSFYYCNNITARDDFNNVFVAEIREGSEYAADLHALLNLYLTGPLTEDLTSPFPADLTIVSIQEADNYVSVVLSDQLAELTGLDLTIACTCLSLTVLELFSCDSVEISTATALLDKQASIVLSRNMLVLFDDAYMITDD